MGIRAVSNQIVESANTKRIIPGEGLLPSMAQFLRPQTAGNWLMPYLGSITPQYIESVLRGGVAGNHVQAYQLFDLMLDTSPEINSCYNEWVDGVLAKKIVVEPYHEEDEEPSADAVKKAQLVSQVLKSMRPDPFSDENDLRSTIKDLLAARFHGQSLLEIDWYDTYGDGGLYQVQCPAIGEKITCPRSTYWVNPTCYAYDRTGRLMLSIPRSEIRSATSGYKEKKNTLTYSPILSTVQESPTNGNLSEFPKNKFLVGINKAKTGPALSGSALRSLSAWWLASCFCLDYLTRSAELFGIPFRSATYKPGLAEQQKAEIRQMLQSMGSEGWALLPEGTVLAFESMTGQGGQSPQAFLFNLADQQIRKVILHQTMTGGSHDSMGKGGGKAFGAVEQDKVQQCIDSGATYIESVLNLQLIPYILRVNYGDSGDLEAPTVNLVDAKVGGLIDAQRDQILATIIDIPTSYFHRTYQIPKPSAGEELAGQDAGSTPAQADKDRQAQMQQAKEKTSQAQAAAQKAQSEGDSSNSDLQNKADAKTDNQPNKDVDASRAIDLLTAAKTQGVDEAAGALHETVEPLIERLRAIDSVTDSDARKKLLQKFLKDYPTILSAMLHDKGLAKVVTTQALMKFVKGLNSSRALHASSEPGHPFYGNQWTGGQGGISLKRTGEGKESKWVTNDDKEIPEHAAKLGIPPAWKNVRIAPSGEHDLQAIGEDSKGRVQRIYSDAATQRSADEKFSRNSELMEKQHKIFSQNEENLKSADQRIRENAACMKVIQHTGIRPGSDTDTGAEKQAYGATTLEGRHVHIDDKGNVALKFVGKKGVDLNIPVEDKSTASMLIARKEASGANGKLFETDDAKLRDYSHTLDGGSFKPKDFRTLKGTNTAVEEIDKNPTRASSIQEYKKRVMGIAKKVSEKLGNTPTIALQSYINPSVFSRIKPA